MDCVTETVLLLTAVTYNIEKIKGMAPRLLRNIAFL